MRHGGRHVFPLQQQSIVDNTDLYIDNEIILQVHPRKDIVAEPEEESKKQSEQDM